MSCVGEITSKCEFVNQKIQGQRPSNFLIYESTLSNGFSGLNHKSGHVKTNVYIYMAQISNYTECGDLYIEKNVASENVQLI